MKHKDYKYIQLRVKECRQFAVQVFDDVKLVVDKEGCTEFVNSTNTYLDSDRARQLAFALLSAAKKLERRSKVK